MKFCNLCKADKSLDDFYNNKAANDGKSTYCKPCWSAYMREQDKKHKKRKAARVHAYYMQNRERKAEITREWRKVNKKRILAVQAEYRKNNSNVIAAKQSDWARQNPHKIRANALRQIAKRKGATIYTILDRDVLRILMSPCSVNECTNKDIELDHVIPLSRGGSHGIGNMQPLCSHHNRVKNNKTNMEFRLHLHKRQTPAA
jgi:5-methylcytosine-specific restriction endonuclease McrA